LAYRVREVDGLDEEIVDVIRELHDECFGDSAPNISAEEAARGHWWLAYAVDGRRELAGFCGLTPTYADESLGYLKRAAVRKEHRGQSLQRRFVRVREAKARRLGMRGIITDTSDNPSSANNLIKCGYRMFTPEHPWGFRHTCYWEKNL
jgi:GNAT superfamily N-acetyltransferase